MLRGLCLFVAVALAALPARAQPAQSSPQDAAFSAWLARYAAEARERGVRPEVASRELAGLTFNPRVVELDRAQPDDSSAAPPSYARYLARRLEGRVEPGRQLREELAPTLARIEARHGVPGRVLLAIWGMETSYGGYVGGFDLVRSLASLAYEGRRRELFTRELDAALILLGRGVVRREDLVGSWAGATGQPQFLPSSYLKLAVDGDGDGRADIWRSRADTLASIANYLARNGWQRGLDWGMPVIVPAGFDPARVRNLVRPDECPRVYAKHSRWIPIGEWRRLGFIDVQGKGWPPEATLATLVEPDGPGRGAYLTYGNYRALLAYNCSNFYALSVGTLADRLR